MDFIFQFPIGLFDCNETKTADVIELLSDLQRKYVPKRNEEIVEPLFFGGEIYFLQNIVSFVSTAQIFHNSYIVLLI